MKIMKFAILGVVSLFIYSCSNFNSSNSYPESSSEIEDLLVKQQGYAAKKQMDSVLIMGIQIRLKKKGIH